MVIRLNYKTSKVKLQATTPEVDNRVFQKRTSAAFVIGARKHIKFAQDGENVLIVQDCDNIDKSGFAI